MDTNKRQNHYISTITSRQIYISVCVHPSIKYLMTSNEASYEFVIKKPFWTAWWFILVILILLAFYLLVCKIEEKRVKKIERFSQEKIQFQFETLRNQVNPHFLFNSFNTLISIIEDDPKMAVEYVEQSF